MKELLLVIDMQKAYEGEKWHVPGMAKAAANIRRLLRVFPDALFTKHVTPQHPVGTWARYKAAWADMDADPANGEIIDALSPFTGRVEEKTTYSALGSPAIRAIAAQYDRLIITGVETEFCVAATLLHAVDMGIDVVYVADACAGELVSLEEAIGEIVRRMPSQATYTTTNALLEERGYGRA